eukprot:gnl/Spiro4/16923_TR9126_c0_g2_i1.p1 gnl/Spiro4/16923_TR9126_c0_g2~~gnl/Spiro4/16923_TR9126_c0_g2_i1.p1  ORF type:complete len:241 (+),score=66.47 gnl/Spiro4/16923_TR9126_c0_g2_i1:90-812(+)
MRLVLALLLCSLCVSAMPHVSVVGVANSLPWTEFLAVTTESRSMAQVTQEISDELVTQLVHEMFTQRAWPMLLASITIGDAPKITSSVTESVTYLLEDPTIIATLTLDITKKVTALLSEKLQTHLEKTIEENVEKPLLQYFTDLVVRGLTDPLTRSLSLHFARDVYEKAKHQASLKVYQRIKHLDKYYNYRVYYKCYFFSVYCKGRTKDDFSWGPAAYKRVCEDEKPQSDPPCSVFGIQQ